jgi:hypothetical protein
LLSPKMNHTSGDRIGYPRTVLNVRPTFLDPLHAREGTRAEIAAALDTCLREEARGFP